MGTSGAEIGAAFGGNKVSIPKVFWRTCLTNSIPRKNTGWYVEYTPSPILRLMRYHQGGENLAAILGNNT